MGRRKRLAKQKRELNADSVPPAQIASLVGEPSHRRRTERIWLAILSVVVVAPILYDANRTPMRRNLYETRAECLADYSESECATEPEVHTQSSRIEDRSRLRYHGPWYGETSTNRTASDPGPGRRMTTGPMGQTTTSTPTQVSSRPISSYEPGVKSGFGSATPSYEPGVRGGFGRTGSIRAGRFGFGG